MKLKIYTDGASRGNPGPGAIAFIIIKGNRILKEHKHYIGKCTNNVAEYRALSWEQGETAEVSSARISL